MFLNWNVWSNSWVGSLRDLMNMFYNLNYLRHQHNSFDNLLNVIFCVLCLDCGVWSFNNFRFRRNLNCFNSHLVHDYFSENLFFNLYFYVFNFLFDNFLQPFSKNLNFSFVVNFFWHLFDLVYECSHRYVSIGLHLDWNFLIMDEMLWLEDLDDCWLLNDLRNVNWMKSFMILMNNFIHIKNNFSRNLNRTLNIDCFFLHQLHLLWNLNVFDGFRGWDLFDNFDFNWCFYSCLKYLWNGDCGNDWDLFDGNLRNSHNLLNDLLSNDRFLHDKLNRDLLLERNHNLPVFNCDLVDLYNSFHNSISINLDWNLPDHLHRDSPFYLHLLGNLSFDYKFNFLFSFNILYLFHHLDNRNVNNDFLYYLSLLNNWHFSYYLHNLKVRHLNSYYFLNNTRNFNYLLNYSWNWNNSLYNFLDFNNSWNLNNLFDNSINKNCLNLNDLSFHDHRHWHLNSHFFDNLLSHWDYFRYLMIYYFWLLSDNWQLNLNIYRFFLFEIQRNHLLNL
jgi:hypothetical protein